MKSEEANNSYMVCFSNENGQGWQMVSGWDEAMVFVSCVEGDTIVLPMSAEIQ